MARRKTPRESSETQQALMSASLEVLGKKGIDGTTARAIATVANVNQALIFYHFGSVSHLLVSAVEQMSESRFVVYKSSLDGAENINDLIEVLFEVFEEDRDSDSYFVLNQFLAAAQNDEVIAASVEPLFTKWIELARDSMQRIIGEVNLPGSVTLEDIAFMALSFFLGVRMMGSIKEYETRIDDFLAHVQDAAPMVVMLTKILGVKPS